MRFFLKGIPFVLFALFFFLLFFASPPAFPREVLPFGFCPKYNPRIMVQLYQPFIDYLNETTPYQFELKLSRYYQEIVDQVGRGEILIASCGPVSYIKARERYGVRPIVRALSKDGNPSYRGITIVRRDSPIQRLQDLVGKRFAFGQAWSTAGHLLPQYYLMKAGIGLRDLKAYAFLRHHDSVVGAVLKGQYDAGAVKDIVAYQHEKEGLRFIFITDPIPTVPIIAAKKAPSEMIASVRSALLRLGRDPSISPQRMALWDEEFKYGFTEAKDSDYDPIRVILRAIPLDSDKKGRVRD